MITPDDSSDPENNFQLVPVMEAPEEILESNVNDDTLPKDENDNEIACDKTSRKPCCSRCMSLFHRYPRISAFVFGIIVPLWMIVFICAFFGYFLAKAEGPNEVSTNNLLVSEVMMTQNETDILKRLSDTAPQMCWNFYSSGDYLREEWEEMLYEKMYG